MEVKGFLPISERPRYIKGLIYGIGGVGKTRFCADAPTPCWFDSEDSAETLRHWPEFKHIPVKVPDTIDELRRDVVQIVKEQAFETIVIDSITTFLDMFLMKKAASRNKGDKFDVWESDYKYATQVFKDLLTYLQHAPINVIIIGHERITYATDDQGNEMKDKIVGIYPDVTPALQKAMTRLVNVVGYLEAEQSSLKGLSRKLYVNATKKISAKNRLNISETFIENPTWKELFND